MSHLISALIVTAIGVWAVRWVWLHVSAKGRALRDWASNLRPKEKAERQAKAEKSPTASPPPSKIAAGVGAGVGGVAQGAVLAWKAGWPGFLLGWDRGRAWVNDRWLNRQQPAALSEPVQDGSGQLDLTRCPECRYDLAENDWPEKHKNPKTKKPCDYDWSTDDRWKNCPKCGDLYPPGIDKCANCDHRVATGPTRWDKPADTAEPQEPGPISSVVHDSDFYKLDGNNTHAWGCHHCGTYRDGFATKESALADAAAHPGPCTPRETPPAPAESASKGSPTMAITETGPAEINTIADLRQAATANLRQAQAELEDATAAVTRAQVAMKYVQAVADAAPRVLDNDPAAAAAQSAQIEPAAAALKAAQAHRTSAEAKFNAASQALRALQPHIRMEQAKAETGTRASSQTAAYATN